MAQVIIPSRNAHHQHRYWTEQDADVWNAAAAAKARAWKAEVKAARISRFYRTADQKRRDKEDLQSQVDHDTPSAPSNLYFSSFRRILADSYQIDGVYLPTYRDRSFPAESSVTRQKRLKAVQKWLYRHGALGNAKVADTQDEGSLMTGTQILPQAMKDSWCVEGVPRCNTMEWEHGRRMFSGTIDHIAYMIRPVLKQFETVKLVSQLRNEAAVWTFAELWEQAFDNLRNGHDRQGECPELTWAFKCDVEEVIPIFMLLPFPCSPLHQETCRSLLPEEWMELILSPTTQPEWFSHWSYKGYPYAKEIRSILPPSWVKIPIEPQDSLPAVPVKQEEARERREVTVDDTCPICYLEYTEDQIALVGSVIEPYMQDSIIWCQTCGTNVHRDCMQEWLRPEYEEKIAAMRIRGLNNRHVEQHYSRRIACTYW